VYTFEGSTGQQVIINLESLDFDTYLAVFTPEDKLLAEHDDISQENSNSELTITLPMTGSYRIIVNSYDNTGRGNYSLIVR
ncbi:MAG: peptidase, partial [Okeania sp. SIO2H7]|nr:peptidase [Okeania sp. SIO2H7]